MPAWATSGAPVGTTTAWPALAICLRWGLMRPPCALKDLPAGVGLLLWVANATCRSLAHCKQVVGSARRYTLFCENVRWLPGPSLPPWIMHQRCTGGSMEGWREEARRKK